LSETDQENQKALFTDQVTRAKTGDLIGVKRVLVVSISFLNTSSLKLRRFVMSTVSELALESHVAVGVAAPTPADDVQHADLRQRVKVQAVERRRKKHVVKYYLQGMSNRVTVATPLTEAMESASLSRGGVRVHTEEGSKARCCPRKDNRLHSEHFNCAIDKCLQHQGTCCTAFTTGYALMDSVQDGSAPSGWMSVLARTPTTR
jgi:hypothetical protein